MCIRDSFKSGHDINPQSTEEVDEVVKELKAQKPLVQAYVMDEIFDKMIGGEAAIGVYYSGDAITMIDDNPDPVSYTHLPNSMAIILPWTMSRLPWQMARSVVCWGPTARANPPL